MRTFMVVPLAGLLVLGAAAPVLAAPNVGNFGGSATVAQGGWDSYDEATETFESGYVVVARDSGSSETYAEYSQYTEVTVQCTGADTPADETDDTWASNSSFRYGYGTATLTIGKKGALATASGTLSVSEGTFDGCTGEETYAPKDTTGGGGESVDVPFSLSLTATSGTIKESGRSSFKLPGQFNSHSSYKSTYRLAEGTFEAGNGTQAVSGQFGTVSWMDHSNG
ncbi:MAG TPA: hypothetical protein VFY18_05935 [Candidatus Limnocylindrales bacterium]|nr:hypothetical protein [Candidatus Limnocylindrales bacterium]